MIPLAFIAEIGDKNFQSDFQIVDSQVIAPNNFAFDSADNIVTVNTVFGVTASPKEYKSYVDLVTRQPEVSKTYLAYFGDIYTSNSDLLPAFDVVTLFHLCEFRDESNSRYGAKTDAEVLDLVTTHRA